MRAKFAILSIVALLVGFTQPVYSQDSAKTREDGGKNTKNVEGNNPYQTANTREGKSPREKRLWNHYHGGPQGENKDQPENVSHVGQAPSKD